MNYLNGVDGMTSARRTVSRVAHVLGAAAGIPATPAPSTALAKKDAGVVSAFVRELRSQAPPDIKDGAGTLVGAAAGAFLWKKHRWLGGIGGASLGRNAMSVLDPAQRKEALCNLGITSAGIIGSLTVPKHPVIGFVLGWFAGGAATYYGGMR